MESITAAIEWLIERVPFAAAHESMVSQRYLVPYGVPTWPRVKGDQRSTLFAVCREKA